MNARRVLLRLVAFFAAFAAAISLVVLLTPASRRARHVPPPAPRAFILTEDLDTDVELVMMDRENKVTHTQIDLRLVSNRFGPEKLWVRTYFFAHGDPLGRVWAGDAVEISEPFAENSRVMFTATARCDWCDDEGVPEGGYFARVQISDGTDMTPLARGPQFSDITTAAPVVVHAERAASLRP